MWGKRGYFFRSPTKRRKFWKRDTIIQISSPGWATELRLVRWDSAVCNVARQHLAIASRVVPARDQRMRCSPKHISITNLIMGVFQANYSCCFTLIGRVSQPQANDNLSETGAARICAQPGCRSIRTGSAIHQGHPAAFAIRQDAPPFIKAKGIERDRPGIEASATSLLEFRDTSAI